MPKSVTLRLTEEVYHLLSTLADSENRTLSNFIETSLLKQIEENRFADEFEMAEIQGNRELNSSLKRGLKDAKARRGRFAE
jgi:predicted transcriptional regulator